MKIGKKLAPKSADLAKTQTPLNKTSHLKYERLLIASQEWNTEYKNHIYEDSQRHLHDDLFTNGWTKPPIFM